VTGQGVPGQGLRFAPFGSDDLAEYLRRSRAHYEQERVEAGDTVAEASANAEASQAQIFPEGRPAPGHLLGAVMGAEGRVGTLWVGPAADDPSRWWVWDIEIDEAERGRGHGRAGMLLAEELARAAGAVSLGLNVFAHNTVARHLYSSLGYSETAVQMRKELT
jgi:ribosomal protein S18 acetylase RimI-like enzyme